MGKYLGNGKATFIIFGNTYTKSCRFCNVHTDKPLPVGWEEPKMVAESICLMKFKHAAITSVDWDNLKDTVTMIWEQTVNEVRKSSPEITTETFIGGFQGK
jgi:lipoic acid synthetase